MGGKDACVMGGWLLLSVPCIILFGQGEFTFSGKCQRILKTNLHGNNVSTLLS